VITLYAICPIRLESELDLTTVFTSSDGSVELEFFVETGQKATITLTKEAIERIYLASQEAQQ
jgi:hypothetical protein